MINEINNNSISQNDTLATSSTNSSSVDSIMFALMLQESLNKSLASVASFDDVGEESSFMESDSIFGESSSLLSGSSSLFGTDSSSLLGTDISSLLGTDSLFGDSSSLLGSSSLTSMLSMLTMLNSGSGSGLNSMAYFGQYNNVASMSNADYLSGNTAFRNTGIGSGLNNYNPYLSGVSDSVYPTLPNVGGLDLPDNPGEPATYPISSNKSNRSASLYNSVVSQFDVENTYRYQKRGGNTYCNIYVWDVTSAMGAEIPYYTDSNGNIIDTSTSGGTYMNANRMNDWLDSKGSEYGWVKVTAEQAQKYANMGYPSVASWKNPSGGHGHIQMVVPSKDGSYSESKGVTISQAGSKNIEYGYIDDVYKASALDDVEYYVNI